METSVITSRDTHMTTTTHSRERKAKSEEDREYEDDDMSLKRIKVKTSSKQDLMNFPTAASGTQSILYSNKLSSKRSLHSPLDTSSSNLRINDSNDFRILIKLSISEFLTEFLK